MVRKLLISKDAAGKSRAVTPSAPPLAHSIPCRSRGPQIGEAECKPCASSGLKTVPVFDCLTHGQCVVKGSHARWKGEAVTLQNCLGCADYDPQAVIAPAHRLDGSPAWHGVVRPKPWEYQVTAVIPHLDTPEELELAIELLQLQTVKPYVVVIDTGSRPEYRERVESLRSWSVEVHCLAFNGVKHSSDLPAIAMDTALAMCRTEWLFCTHADVFARRRDLMEWMLSLAHGSWPVADGQNGTATHPAISHPPSAIGYQMTRRAHPDWERMVSHTCTLLHIPTMDRIGAGWNLRRCCELYGEAGEHIRQVRRWDNWPDTELLLNYLMWDNGITPENGGVKIIGEEENQQRTVDANIDHCRSLTVARLYSSDDYRLKCEAWTAEAKQAARERIAEWRSISASAR